jgi:hypothetical protein
MVLAAETFDFPIRYINEYLYSEFSKYEDINMAINGNITSFTPFFPAGQAADLTKVYQDLQTSEDGMIPAVLFYDRMIRLRSSAFPIGKREQVLYTVYGSIPSCTNIGNVMLGVLDREDYSAQDLNKWMSDNKASLVAKGMPMKVFFRGIRVFQADESRDLVELDGYKRGSIHKYIVEYDYHFKDNPDFL